VELAGCAWRWGSCPPEIEGKRTGKAFGAAMSYTRKITLTELRTFESFGKLIVSFDTIRKQVNAGARLICICSSIDEPGDDWTDVYVEHKDGNRDLVARWEGC